MKYDIRRGLAIAFGCAVAMIGTSAIAAPTTYQFSGTITSAALFGGSSNPAWSFASGQSFRGTLIYDPDAISRSTNYIDTPNRQLTFYYSPLLSFSYQIDTPTGTFSYAPPAVSSQANVGVSTTSMDWTGVDMRWHNYPINGAPQTAVPTTSYVGPYYAHSSFLSLLDYASRPLSGVGPDVDLAALFAALPRSDSAFSVRFSDPTRWPSGVERIDGVVSGRIDRFVVANSAVPEPATWLMMILGFGLIGAGARRRSTRLVPLAA